MRSRQQYWLIDLLQCGLRAVRQIKDFPGSCRGDNTVVEGSSQLHRALAIPRESQSPMNQCAMRVDLDSLFLKTRLMRISACLMDIYEVLALWCVAYRACQHSLVSIQNLL